MRELVLSGNDLTKLKLQNLAPRLRGANIGGREQLEGRGHRAHRLIALFDSHSLFADMYANPKAYLNGTAPTNVTGAVDTCVYELNADTPSSCIVVQGNDRDSYLWYVGSSGVEFVSLTAEQVR